jgi:hypothetical protein
VEAKTKFGSIIYGTSLVLAVIAGLMTIGPILAFAAVSMIAGGGNPIFLLISGPWVICSIAAVFLLGSRSTLSPKFAMASAAIAVFVSGWGLILVARSQKLYDPLYLTTPIPEWAWTVIPLVFNVVLAVFAILRYRQLRTLEVTPCPH